jgi:uncharacterized membrane protein YqgA involved in biofilm formation
MTNFDRHCYRIETRQTVLDKILSIALACAIGISLACVLVYFI